MYGLGFIERYFSFKLKKMARGLAFVVPPITP
jgi:hypothetical protein